MCVPATGRQGSSMSIHSWEAVKLYICSFLGISLYLSLLYGLPLLLIVPILSREDVDDDEFPRIPSCPPPTTIFCLHDLVHLQLCRISIAGATAQELECIPTSCSSAATLWIWWWWWWLRLGASKYRIPFHLLVLFPTGQPSIDQGESN